MRKPVPWVPGLLLLVAATSSFQAICPSVCTCKWKAGKRWVECTNKGQISIPERIDPETQVLDLGGNNLQILPREVFSRHGLLNLQKLKLSDCNIGQIDPTAFRGLTNLVELDLSSNLLTSVPTPTFSDIPYLRELALNNNPLQKIEGHAFEMVSQIVSLDVSGCQIKKVAARAFNQIEALERLYLHNNKIDELKQRTVESVSTLHSLTLHGNPWACDCHLRPLLDWLQATNLPMIDLPTCKTPKRLAGQRFADIPIDNFACPPDLLAVSRYVEANTGSNATVSCKVLASPSASVRWLRAGQQIRNNSRIGADRSRKFVIHESGGAEILSQLVLPGAEEADAGQYLCVAENKAGRTEANFTLAVGYFTTSGPLNAGEIVGIAITLLLLLLIVMVVIGVLVLKLRPNVLRTEKFFGGENAGNSTDNGGRALEMNYTTVQNGSSGVVIDGTTYTHATNGIGATGYINPDVVPTLQSPVGDGRGPPGSLKRVKNRVIVEESEEAEQNRQNGRAVSGLRPENHLIGGEGGGGKHRYQNFPPPLSSMGTSTSLSGDPGTLQPEDVYSGSSLYSQRPDLPRHSFSPSPRFEHRGYPRFPPTNPNDTLDSRLGGAVNCSFAEEEVGAPMFHRNHQFQPNVFLSSPNGFRTLRPGHSLDPSSHSGHHFAAVTPHGQPGTLPRNFTHSSLPPAMSQSMTHSTPLRPDWEASPVLLPEWTAQQRPFPPDYGLPRAGRAEVHLAHNPLGTLPEEEDFTGAQYSSGAIQALELLNQSGVGYTAFKTLLDNSSSQESSGRGSSSSGSSKVWSSVAPHPAKASFPGCSSARESPDEGIQTDSGTDV